MAVHIFEHRQVEGQQLEAHDFQPEAIHEGSWSESEVTSCRSLGCPLGRYSAAGGVLFVT